MEKGWLPSLLGEVELGRKEHVFEGEAELEALSGSEHFRSSGPLSKLLNTHRSLVLHL